MEHVTFTLSQQNGWHFADNIFKCIFLDENACIYFPWSSSLGHADNKSTWVMAWWYQTQTITWINSLAPGRFERLRNCLQKMSLDLTNDESTLVQVMAWCHQDNQPLLEPIDTTPQWVNTDPILQCCMASQGHNRVNGTHYVGLSVSNKFPLLR